MVPPTTTADSLLARVRRTCEEQLQKEGCTVTVNDDRIKAFLEELDGKEYEELGGGLHFPLNFKSLRDEVNFLTLVAMLNFGSGYRKDLHKLCERGAHETIVFGLLGMYISAPNLGADYLSNMSIDVLANYFSMPLDREEQISTGIYISKPGPLRPLAELLHKALTESATILKQRGYDDFGAFVLANLRPRHDPQATPSAAHLVQQLVDTFPAFDDSRESRGSRVFFLKRAQLVPALLYKRFRETEADFQFDDIVNCTAMSDNVLPCVLRALGILEYNEELAGQIDRAEELPAGDWECDLRAAAVVACDRIVAASDGRVDIVGLDTYLWRVGKNPRYRSLERHATRNTFFY